jgi:putative ABC transport system permease protein
VVFQFTLSIVLILATVLIVRQIRYISQRDIGYSRDNLLYVPLDGDLASKYDVFKTAAMQFPGVAGVTQVSDPLTNLQNDTQDISWDEKSPSLIPNFAVEAAGYDFTRTMNLKVVQGRDFSKDFPGDSNAYIVNEAALAQIGYKDPIGRSLTFWHKKGTIVGVVHDFNFESMHYAIRPIIFRKGQPGDFSFALLKLRGGQTAQSLKAIGDLCHSLNPKFPFTYQFADEQYSKLYQSEQVTGGLAVLAIFISCLGLLGLSMFSAERRSREISIRKVLGAGGLSLFRLLTTEFLVLIGISFAIAVPTGWWYMHQWLQHYFYQTNIPWWLFVLVGLLTMGIALATILFQTIRAVLINPAVKLRSE